MYSIMLEHRGMFVSPQDGRTISKDKVATANPTSCERELPKTWPKLSNGSINANITVLR